MSKKVLHVLGKLDAGGVESWLITLLKKSDPSKVSHNFLVQKKGEGFFDKDVYEFGGSINNCYEKNIFLYAYKLYFFLKNYKPDVVHSHVHTFSGFIIFIAFLAGVKIRISHSHSDTRIKENNASLFRKIYSFIMKHLIKKFSTFRLAVSEKAAISLYGENWEKDKFTKLMPCGIDTEKYGAIKKDKNLRNSFGIPENSFVMGHVGRFEEPKNHKFLIDIFYELRKNNSKAYLVLVGDGSLRAEIERKIQDLDLEPYVILIGLRKDVPVIMLNIFDTFVFPSLWEGLPLTLVEAQLSGLNCFASSNITKNVDIGLVNFIDNYDAEIWANKILLNAKECKRIKNFYEFSIESNIKLLDVIYSN